MCAFRIEVLEGNLIRAKTDVCVSSIHRSKEMSYGPLAGYIYKNAGDDVQTELKQINRELNHGEVVKTDPGNLSSFRFLLFCCLYKWREGNERALAQAVKKCCEEASSQKAKSIAFPCLGTGGQKYPVVETATAVMEGIMDFMSAHPVTSLERIVIVLPHKDIDWLKMIHMFNKGKKESASALDDDEDLKIYIPSYDKIRKAKPTRALAGTVAKSQTTSLTLPPQNASQSLNRTVYMKKFGPFSVYADLDHYNTSSGYEVSARVGVDAGLLGRMFQGLNN